MKVVNLTGEELILIAHRASMISGLKIMRKIKSKKYDSHQSEFEIAMIGAMGEHVVAKELNTTPRYDITDLGDGGIDLEVGGTTIQIKTRKKLHKENYCFVDSLDELKSRFIVGCVVLSPTQVGIDGFMTRKRFAAECFDHDFGYGNRKCVEASSMADIERFGEALACLKVAA